MNFLLTAGSNLKVLLVCCQDEVKLYVFVAPQMKYCREILYNILRQYYVRNLSVYLRLLKFGTLK